MSIETKKHIIDEMCGGGGRSLSNRGKELSTFCEILIDHVEEYTVPQYGDAPNDQVESWDSAQCVKQIGKYAARFESNARGFQEKFTDLKKIGHYACLAFFKLWRETYGDG